MLCSENLQAKIREGLEGVYVKKTRICYIDDSNGKLYYRGYDINDLVKHSTFEEVVYLIWFGKLPTKTELESFTNVLKGHRNIPEEFVKFLDSLPKKAHPIDVLRLGISILALQDTEPENRSFEANIRRAIDILAKAPTIIATWDRVRKGLEPIEPSPKLNHAANFLYMLKGEEPDSLSARIMDVILILHAEHEINPSTFTAMVIGSTLSDVYSTVIGGLCALKGPLHGGASEKALNMLLEIGDPEKAESYILDKLRRKEKIMGFGHKVYKTYDPRAKILKDYAKELSKAKGDDALLRIAEKVESIVIREIGQKKKVFPNIDFYSGIIYYLLKIPHDLSSSIFAMARIVGWIAHVMEYWETNRVIRPRALYVGELGKKYVPLNNRDVGSSIYC